MRYRSGKKRIASYTLHRDLQSYILDIFLHHIFVVVDQWKMNWWLYYFCTSFCGRHISSHCRISVQILYRSFAFSCRTVQVHTCNVHAFDFYVQVVLYIVMVMCIENLIDDGDPIFLSIDTAWPALVWPDQLLLCRSSSFCTSFVNLQS